MIVSELIQKLQDCRPDVEVLIEVVGRGSIYITSEIAIMKNGSEVIIYDLEIDNC